MTAPRPDLPARPANPTAAMLARAAALADLGRAGDAEAVLRDVLALSPAHPVALGRLAGVQLQLGRPRDALATADRLVAARPEGEWGHRLRSIALARRGRGFAALAAAREALRLDPRNAYAHDTLARAQLVVLRTRAARTTAEARRALAPRDPESYVLLADVAKRRERAAEVEAHARAALALDPVHQRATELLAWALLARGRTGAAVDAALEAALEAARRAPSRAASAQFVRAARAVPRDVGYALALGAPCVVLGATGIAAWLTPAPQFRDVVRGVFFGGIAAWVAAMAYAARRHRRGLRPEVRAALEAATLPVWRRAVLFLLVLAWIGSVLGAFFSTLVIAFGGPAARPHTLGGWAAYAGGMLAVVWGARAFRRYSRRPDARHA